MRYTNNKPEKSKLFRGNNSLWQRALSFITVFALVVNTMYSGGVFGLFNFSTVIMVSAEEEAPAYTPVNDVSAFSGTEQVFPDSPAGYRKFVDYCYYYSINKDSTFCDSHKGDTLKINFPILPDGYSFMGLGNASVPFAGKVTFVSSAGRSSITLPRALFTHVSTDARITDNSDNNITLEMSKNSSASSPIFADCVHQGTNSSNWSVEVSSSNTNSFAGVIGQIESNASVVLSFKNASTAVVSNTASAENDIKDVGELCGIMKNGSSLTVTDTTENRTAVSSANGNAGSLVGTMEGTAHLTMSSYPALSNVSVASETGYAGGLVGKMASTATISGLSSPEAVGGTVTGKTGAGGLYGYYENSAAIFDLKDYTITTTVSADYCGGVFGVLDNTKGSNPSISLTIQNTGDGTVNVNSGSSATSGYFGGIAGQYTTDDLKNSLIFGAFSATANSNAAFDAFGGAIGTVNTAAYIKADGLSVTATGTQQKDSEDYFGGLIGKTSDAHGVFVDLGDFKLSADSDGFKGGGVVGGFKNGVLRLSGTTNLSSAKSQKGGQLVGANDNVLVYALGNGQDGTAYGNGWTFQRSFASQVDDLGTWGEVVRISGIESILTLDSSNHTVTVPGAITSISTPSDFVKTALNIQLNQGKSYDCLLFTAGDANKRENLLKNPGLTIGTVSLSGTGITGFMRDGGDDVGAFTGTLTGSGIVTLAIGEKYGKTSADALITASTAGEGLGQIYRHPYNGLFAVVGDGSTGTGSISTLTISGTINVRNKIDGMNIGGIAAVSKGSTSLRDITANQTINYGEASSISGSEAAGKNIGGLIGLAKGSDNGTIAITGTNTISTTFNISDNFNTWSALGAFIGKVTSPKFTIDIAQGASDSLTVSHTMVDIDKSETNEGFIAGGNTDGGGLIGYITSGTYSNRKVNIKNLDFNNCTIINKASNNGGGFLGYAWLDTDTTIDGLTVTNGTITNSSPNVGVMCYKATGRWTVNDLQITKMSLSDGAGTSLGMLVNMAYDGEKGLYLDVLNAGYTLTKPTNGTDVSLPSSLQKYDELAAYSAEDAAGVLAGGAGVISINMNAARDTANATVTATGTYQNQLSVTSTTQASNYANETARYYYNLDQMSDSDAGQNLLLWSVSKYAASNIRDEFIKGQGESYGTTITNTISGACNMTGLSFYPIVLQEGVTLNNLTLTMNYSGLFGAENTFTANNQTDSYTRDPALRNQHYLMQSGMFISLPNTQTLTLSGNNTLKGDFLEISGVSGVLISGTSNGSIISSNNSTLVLDGIVAKTTGNTDYTTGYLLVNQVARIISIDPADDITIRLEGISTTNTYGSGTTVAKSLLGAASGENLNIEFTKIKLDSRESGTLRGDTSLDNAYGTTHSIFTDSTLLASISTDDRAQLKYYYTITEDWGSTGTNGIRWVTYGKEIKDSVEYRDNNGSLENKYDGSTYYTHPTTYQSGSAYDFSTGFLPYVAEPFTAAQTNALYYRELKVNVSAEGLTKGCGTYNDPYVITDGKQLTAVSRFIASSTASTDELSKVNLPKAKAYYDSIGENTSGARWCTDKTGDGYHLQFTPNSAGTGYENGSITWTAQNVQYYLANAYYKIGDNIELSGDSSTGFVGLGGTSANTAFRGVIVGEKNQDGTPKYSITNNSINPFIKVSNGSVIKDVKVLVNAGTITLTQSAAAYNNAYFGYDSKCQYYGGIIGEIMGGDNIIDNSYVKYSYTDNSSVAHTTTITLTDNNSSKFGTIVPVGGYVGVVVFGGLVFKNMTASNTTVDNTGLKVYYKTNTSNNLAANTVAAKAAIYVNPIVGRVINGYAVNETTKFSVDEDGKYQDDATTERFSTANNANSNLIHTLKNGTKHYTIADINKNEANKLSVAPPTSASADGTINIPNSQAFFILSLITQSCAGTAQTANGNYTTSLSYGTNTTVYGMSHNADYSDVGKATSDTDYGYASADTAANTAVPYIIRWYTADSSNNYPARCVTSTKGYYNINLIAKTTYSVDSYTYQLPDSFRGLGSVGFYDYNTTILNNMYSMKVDSFNGNGCTIDQDIYLNKFETDNYFDTLHKGVNQGLDDATNNGITITGNTDKNKLAPRNHGVGLFDSIILKTKITNFTLTGSVNTENYNNSYSESNQERNYVITNNDDSKVLWLSSGGVCGWIRDGVTGEFSFINLNDLTVSGADFVGGIIGFSGLSDDKKHFTIKQCNANNISVEMTSARNIESSAKARNGIGCFVGKIQEGAVYIYGTSAMDNNNHLNDYSFVIINSFKFADDSLNYYTAAGGLVGYAGNGCKVYDMKVMPSEGKTVTIGNNNIKFVGGFVGAMQSKDSGGTSGVAVFRNCTVERINLIGNYVGGFYGGKWDSNWTTYSLTFDNCKVIGLSSSHNTIVGNNLDAEGYAGGFIGRLYPYTNKVSNKVTHNVLIKDCMISNYDITALTTKRSYVGGFIGYASSATNSVTCYLHDSSIESCTIGANGNYAGGIIGKIVQKDANQLLGYNIKLDTITTGAGDKMGAWIGEAPNDTNTKKTSIQLAGMAIYGNGFAKNIGNNATIGTASFVFADYSGASRSFINTTTTTSSTEKQEGDEDSETETFTADSTAKTVSRAVTIVSVGDTETTTETQTTVYPYISVSTADPVSNTSLTENSSVWAVHEDVGTITYTVSDASAHTVTVTTYNLSVSDYNSEDNVVMPKYPYINVNPQSDMGTDKIISGDGAVLASTPSSTATYSGKTAASTMALKIYEDLSATSSSPNYSRRYTTFSDTDVYNSNKISYYMQRSTDDDGDRISTYLDEKGELPSGVENFAVVVIANNETTETTNLINRYIQLVTNTSTDYTKDSDYYTIEVKNCSYSGGKFVTDTTTPGLTWTPPDGEEKGTFALNGASADSKRDNTFTLVDVQFMDPFNTDEIAYHLYIPVYTIKEIEITFSAAVMNGANSVSYNVPAGTEAVNPYGTKLANTATDTHVDNLNTWYTTYIRYTYAHDDIQALLDSGNLNWNHNKYCYIDKYANIAVSMLPANTYMILIDPNGNHDKKYQATLNGTDFAVVNNRIIFDLEKFKDSNNEAFSVSTFNELIAQKITVTPNGSNSGKYDLCSGEDAPENTGGTHYVYTRAADGTPTYYQYVGGEGGYDLTLAAGDVYENYYISMYVPGADSDSLLYGYYIRTPESFDAPTYTSGTNNAVTKSAKVNCVYVGTNENGENTINRQVYIGNVFDQSTELNVLPNDFEIDGGNHTLYIFAKTRITPKNNDVFAILSGINPDIYHSFNIFLDKKDENGVITNKISGIDLENNPTAIQAWYSINSPIPIVENSDNMTGFTSIAGGNIDLEDNYINVVTVNGGQTILQSGGVTIYSKIQIEFDNYEREFPQKVSSDTGVSVRAASNLAYDSLGLAFSNMSQSVEELPSSKHFYYRQSISTAKLKYYAEIEPDSFDTDGLPSENYSRLGVSGLYSMNQYMPVNTIARYNVQNIETALRDAETLELTLSLQKKTDAPNNGSPFTSASYQNVSSLNNYWGAVQRDSNHEVAPNSSGAPVTSTGTNLRIQCGSYDQVVFVADNTTTFTLSIPKQDLSSETSGFTVDENGYIYINIGFNAKTGTSFTEYANYKVNLSVKLMDGQEDITGSYADDYLIYTNAKVNHDFLKHN